MSTDEFVIDEKMVGQFLAFSDMMEKAAKAKKPKEEDCVKDDEDEDEKAKAKRDEDEDSMKKPSKKAKKPSKHDEDDDEGDEDEDDDEASAKPKKGKKKSDVLLETKGIEISGMSTRYASEDVHTKSSALDTLNKGLVFGGKYEVKQCDMFKQAFQSRDCNSAYWMGTTKSHPLSNEHFETLEKTLEIYSNMPNVSKGYIAETFNDIERLRGYSERGDLKAKNAYNSQVATEGGVFGLPYQVMFAKKVFSYSPLLSMYNFIPTVSNVVKVINTATLPQVTAVPEGQLVNDSTIGEYESIDINVRVNYQATLRLTDIMLRSENISVMTKIQEDSSLALARYISFLALLGDGAADGVQGLLYPVNYNITGFSLEQGMYAKPAGMKKVLNNGSSTIINLDSLKALANIAIPPQYYVPGETAFAMNQKTWQTISTAKSSSGLYLFDAIAYPMHGGNAPAEIRNVPYSEMRVEDLPSGGIRNSLQSDGKRMVPHLWGYPVILDPSMPDIGAGSTPVVFGNFRESYTLAQTIAMGIRPVAIGASTANGLVTTGNQFQQGFQVYTQMGGKPTNSQSYACLLMV